MSFSEALVIWMSSTAIKAPSRALITAIQSRRLGSPTGRISWSAGTAGGLERNLDQHRHAWADIALEWVVGGKGQFHRDALHHLGEVAGGVVRWQQAELRAGGGKQAVDEIG